MKRSEMIDAISDLLSFKNGYLREIGDEASAEEVLDLIEKLGMEPPARSAGFRGPLVNEWESEDGPQD